MLMRCFLAVALLAVPQVAVANELYQVSVTRKDSNLYKVDGQEIYILTRYCYEYAYSETAILDLTAMEITFTDSGGTQCDVVKLLK